MMYRSRIDDRPMQTNCNITLPKPMSSPCVNNGWPAAFELLDNLV